MATNGSPARAPQPQPQPEKKPARFVIKVAGTIPT